MIDLHTHILPDLDGGTNSFETAVQMAKEAQKNGITHMVASSQRLSENKTRSKEEVLQHTSALNHKLRERQIDVEILPGHLVPLHAELIHEWEKGEILTINQSNYLLIELPKTDVPVFTTRLFYEIQLMGVKPVITHPERNQEIRRNPDKLYELVKQGAFAQLSAGSLTGRFGKNIKKVSEQMISHNLIHFVASETQNQAASPNDLRAAFQILEKKFGVNKRYYLQENAELLVKGESVLAEPPSRIKKKKFLRVF